MTETGLADPAVVAAIAFAVGAHGRQQRKDGRTPYVVHPVGVLRHLAGDLGVRDPTILAAAALHDVLEDTATSREELTAAAGPTVAALVEELTVPPAYHGPAVPDARKTEVLVAALGRMSWPAVAIKLCDRWDNLRDLPNAPWSEEKRRAYLAQTESLLVALEARRRTTPPPPELVEAISRAAGALRAQVAASVGGEPGPTPPSPGGSRGRTRGRRSARA